MNLTQEILKKYEADLNDSAVTYEKEKRWTPLTHRRFIQVVKRTANALQGLGVHAGEKVILSAPVTPEWVCVYFSLIGIGAIPVLVREGLNVEEWTQILHQTNAGLVIVGTQSTYDTVFDVAEKEEQLQTIFVTKDKIRGKRTKTVFLRRSISKQKEDFTPTESTECLAEIYNREGTSRIYNLTDFEKDTARLHDFFKKPEDERLLFPLDLENPGEFTLFLFAMRSGMEVFLYDDETPLLKKLEKFHPTVLLIESQAMQQHFEAREQKLNTGWRAGFYQKAKEQIGTDLQTKRKHWRRTLRDILVWEGEQRKLGGHIRNLMLTGGALSEAERDYFRRLGIHIENPLQS